MLSITGLVTSARTTPELAEGIWYWRANARDNAGNTGAWCTFKSFKVNALPVASNQLTDSQINPAHLTDFAPTLSWSYFDADGDTQVQRQVQVGTSENENSMWDSTVSTSSTAVIYAGFALSKNVTYYWRVRVYDNYQWSSWLYGGTFGLSPAFTPIFINGDNNFTSANGVVGGLGMENDPYIIENWVMSENGNGISISNTTSYFVVRNCLVENGGGNSYGISLDNVTNGKIENCTCDNNYKGISLYYSFNNTLNNNKCYNNGEEGIILTDYSFNNTLNNNKCSNNPLGIFIMAYSDNNNLTNNTCFKNSVYGIALGSSYNNILVKNMCDNNDAGIGLHSYSNNILTNNTFSNNRVGIDFWQFSSNNYIYHNNFINNVTQAYDYGSNYYDNGYPSGGNYWSDHAFVDNNRGENQNILGSDGIIDTPYNIMGASNLDLYPLINPISDAYVAQLTLNTTLVDARDETDTTITITTNQEGSIAVIKYDNNPGAPPQSGFEVLGKYIEVRTDVPTYNIVWPIEIKIYYTDNEVAKLGVPESHIRIFNWNGSNWVQEPNSGVNIENNYVWARVTHLSSFAPMGSVNSSPVGTASIQLATLMASPFVWGIRKATVTTSLVVNQGDNLHLIFLAYDNTVESDNVIWSRTAPGAQTVTLNMIIPHPIGNNVKRVKLVLADNAGNVILGNMAWYTVVQDDWSNRISWIILNWGSHTSPQQDQLSNEISAIILNWANVQTTTDQHDFSQP
jgi:parallel beta-helix repeat protein